MEETRENIEAIDNLEQEQPQEQPQHEEPRNEQRYEENFRNIRQAKEQAERERDEYQRRLAEYEKALQQKQQQSEPQNSSYNDDDLIEGRHLKALEARIEEQRRSLEAASTEARLKASYPDFDQVVNQKSIEQLRTQHPELAETLNESSNLYNKAASAYKLIKKFGIGENQAAQKHAHENLAKPQPNTSPLSSATDFASKRYTKDMLEKAYREMEEACR